MTRGTLERGPPPSDPFTSYRVLDGLTGGRRATLDMMSGRAWPGADIAGADILDRRPIRLAQAATGTMGDFAPSMPGLSVPRGAVSIGGVVVTAAAVLAAIDSARERAAVDYVIKTYGLDRNAAADMLAARAWVWTTWMAPVSHWDLPYTGLENRRAAELVMRYEQRHPGTTGLAVSGRDRAAMAILDALIDEAVVGPAYPEPLERTSTVDPALSTSSARARAIVGLSQGGQWVAHHLIPYGVVAGLSPEAQKAIAASGWRMDSAENLIALPANLASYLQQPGRLGIRPLLPYQQGPHPTYDVDTTLLLAPLITKASGIDPAGLRALLSQVEQTQRSRLVTASRYHPRLN